MNVFKEYKAIFKEAVAMEKAGEVDNDAIIVLYSKIVKVRTELEVKINSFKGGNKPKLQRMYTRISYLFIDVDNHLRTKVLN